MTTITIRRGTKKDVDLLVDIAQKLGIEVTVHNNETRPASENKTKAIKELSSKINKSVTRRMLKEHGLL